MSKSIKTILIIGATGGIGESFARFHSMGKKVIITGRRESRLQALAKELPGIETYVMDNSDLASLPARIEELTKSFPDIDTVWINSGIQESFKFADPSTSSNEDRSFRSSWRRRPKQTFMIASSGLGFVPMGSLPVYCPTKAAIHQFMVGLRQQLACTTLNVIEIVPPNVQTELAAAHRSSSITPPIGLEEFTAKVFEILDNGKASELKEVAVGTAANAVEAWRGSIGGILEAMKVGG